MEPKILVGRVRQLLGQHRYMFRDEVALHEAIAKVLTGAGIAFERERIADEKNRFDFWLPAAGERGVVIEVKVDDSLSPALRQAVRYLDVPGTAAVILAATPTWARQVPPLVPKWRDRVFVVHLQRSAL